MELKKRFDLRKAYIVFYVLAVVVYFAIGLTPVDAYDYIIDNQLSIPSIGLDVGVTKLELKERKLDTPENIAGSFSMNGGDTLIIGHSSSIFYNLVAVRPGDTIEYDGKYYTVHELEILPKSGVDMGEVLDASSKETIKLMTCYGEIYDNGDASHRLIITASI